MKSFHIYKKVKHNNIYKYILDNNKYLSVSFFISVNNRKLLIISY